MNSKDILNRIIYLFFPKRCPYCGNVILPGMDICDECPDKIHRISNEICKKCGVTKELCECKGKQPAYKGIIAPFYYADAVRSGIRRFKFKGIKNIGNVLAAEMAKCIKEKYSDIDFDIITCVPMTKKSVKKRGFNQSTLLAEQISKELSIPCDVHILEKIYETPTQHSLKATERSGNVFGVFDIAKDKSVCDKTILLCDDIKTTGATLNECAKMLSAYGAKEIYCVCAAIAGNPDKLTKRNN